MLQELRSILVSIRQNMELSAERSFVREGEILIRAVRSSERSLNAVIHFGNSCYGKPMATQK